MAGQKPAQAAQEAPGAAAGAEPQVDVAALQAALAEAQAQIAALQEPEPAGDRLADVLEMLADKLGQQGVASAGTFAEGETPDQIIASMQGKITRGEHSGNYTPAGVPVVFLSRGVNHRIINRARIRYTDARGELVVTEGVHYDFAPDGRFETDDQDVADYIMRRPSFGSEMWLMGHDPAAVPDPQSIIDTIIEASIELDDARLAVIEEEEQAGLKREVVLKAVLSARRKVQGMPSPAELEGAEASA